MFALIFLSYIVYTLWKPPMGDGIVQSWVLNGKDTLTVIKNYGNFRFTVGYNIKLEGNALSAQGKYQKHIKMMTKMSQKVCMEAQ